MTSAVSLSSWPRNTDADGGTTRTCGAATSKSIFISTVVGAGGKLPKWLRALADTCSTRPRADMPSCWRSACGTTTSGAVWLARNDLSAVSAALSPTGVSSDHSYGIARPPPPVERRASNSSGTHGLYDSCAAMSTRGTGATSGAAIALTAWSAAAGPDG
jgi:hypothetical protein